MTQDLVDLFTHAHVFCAITKTREMRLTTPPGSAACWILQPKKEMKREFQHGRRQSIQSRSPYEKRSPCQISGVSPIRVARSYIPFTRCTRAIKPSLTLIFSTSYVFDSTLCPCCLLVLREVPALRPIPMCAFPPGTAWLGTIS
jgi:hypothetical protein